MSLSEESIEASEGENENVEEPQTEELSGWADSMSKILRSTKPKNKKNLILSRARKDYEVSYLIPINKSLLIVPDFNCQP